MTEINIYEPHRFKASDTCRTCGLPMSGDNLRRDSRGVRHCRACGRRSAALSNERKKLGLPALRQRLVAPPAPKAIAPPQIDHMQCDPRAPESLCDDCAAMFNEARRATA